jgi:superfamily II DNA or RNA helicase
VSMKTLQPRQYQREALDAIHEALQVHNRVAVVLPTGAGKTVVFSHLIRETLERTPNGRVLVLVHRDELAQQAAQKIRSIAPGIDVGIVKAEQNEVHADVIVASVQTLARAHRRFQITGVQLVIADEAHHAVARTWTEVLEHFGCYGPWLHRTSDEPGLHDTEIMGGGPMGTPAVGFTATMYRDDGKGLGNVWETVCYEKDIEWAIDHGYLTDVRGQAVTIEGFDLGQIAKSRGDYQEGQLGAAMIGIGAGDVVACAYWEHAQGTADHEDKLRKGVLFAPTVASAYHFADAFNLRGIPSAVIEGSMAREDRALIYKRYEEGELKVLHNCMVLTEGWDSPSTEVCVVARPTQNPGLYTQMVGRVLRPYPGKTEALVLDVVGIAGRHGLQSLTTLTKINVLDGESLAEAQDRVAAEEREFLQVERIVGDRRSREVELFKASHSVWLQTYGGVWFIPVRLDGKSASVVLYQADGGRWSVGVRKLGRPGEWLYQELDFEAAMAWGEQTAMELDPTVADKNRAWRRGKPSPSQLDLATRLRLAPIGELANYRRGALSDLLSIHFASRDLDKIFGRKH